MFVVIHNNIFLIIIIIKKRVTLALEELLELQARLG